jgi:hypothetical protein
MIFSERGADDFMNKVYLGNRRGIIVETVPEPMVGDNEVLVENAYSLISTGTELHTIQKASQGGIMAQIRRPADVAGKIMRKVNESGVKGFVERMMNPPDILSAIGYSTAGVIVALG